MRRPGCQRTWSASALVIVLAACHRGDPSQVPASVTAGHPASPGGGARGAVTTSPSGQVVTTGTEGLPPALAQRRAQGIAAMDVGRHDLARQAFAEVLDEAPGNLATQALYDSATAAMLEAQSQASERFAGRTATPLAAPPWSYTLKKPAPIEPGPAPTLVQVSESRNAISDDAEWLARNGVALPEYEVPNPMRGEPGNLPPTIPPAFGKYLLVQAIHQDGFNILFYGPDYAGGRFVAVQREDTAEIVALFDFAAYGLAPGTPADERQFAEQRATWAVLAGSALLVSHAHGTYARGSGGDHAYITALDVESGELLWRSAPQVAGAADFLVHRGHVLTGHGDHLFVLDAVTGKTVSKTRVKSGPDYLFLQAGKLLVRCYDTDYVFELRPGGG
ncbi:hypothetical protein [Nannocystis sp. SCPEA4]|uniref:hypothetical protein n=1 Tax=Nannocystis sp. SCPEA4 TaxID=2996787 RepID=UPI002270CD84|nr:hypothetical protein [Nannocystis sp. SCPEA4]MCY1054270.1 hypothetical protein [Nannocystis sp. SCPEA4]